MDSGQVTVRQKQSLFARLIAELILWIYAEGWELTLADIGVTQERKVSVGRGAVMLATDREHMLTSLHYQRLAADLNLFVDGRYVTRGDAPQWEAIGEKWESMDPLCRWGGRFLNPDANHFSLAHAGRA